MGRRNIAQVADTALSTNQTKPNLLIVFKKLHSTGIDQYSLMYCIFPTETKLILKGVLPVSKFTIVYYSLL